MLDRKLSVGFDYFINTRDQILTEPDVTLPEYTGITPPDLNIGEFANKGVEIELGWADETDYGLRYSFNLTLVNLKMKWCSLMNQIIMIDLGNEYKVVQ